MKKIYLTVWLTTLLLSCLSFNGKAQLSGFVTINNTLPSTATNFTSFTAFAAVINTAGVSGPLTVDVGAGSGPYVEQVNFTAIAGTSSTNTITLNGNGCTITFNATLAATPHTYMYSGADYVTVNNLNIVGTGTTYALPCHLWNQSDYNSFNSCTITTNANTTSQNWTPVSISSSSTTVSSAGAAAGNYNTWTSCVVNGGYYGFCFYSNTAAPFMVSNKVMNCTILNTYYVGIFCYYVQDHLFSGNVLERPTLTALSTSYPIFLSSGVLRTIVEKNLIRNQYPTGITSTSTFAGIYIQATASVGNENIIRNNIISDLRSNGQQSGIYCPGYPNNTVVHNTISFDDGLATAGTTYGIYYTTGPGIIKNNIITITRGGTGTKYCLYYGTAANLSSDNNVLYINAPAGSNSTGYFSAAAASLSAWKLVNNGLYDQFSSNADPLYTTPGSNYAPTALAVNNLGTGLGVLTDINNVTRNAATPDPGAIEIFNVACFGSPANSTVTAPTPSYCAGTTVNISFAASIYSNSGYSYQWVSGTGSPLGPFTAIPGATLASYNTSSLVNVSTYYSVRVVCAGGGTTTIPSNIVNMVLTTTSVVPYYESFESLNTQNKLPNCSWAVSNAATALTQTISNPNGRIPRTGTNFGMFSNATPGVNYFYTNGIFLTAGFTYSASVWYLTESVGYTNWTDLSILVGQNQSPSGQVQIASTNGPAISATHKLLSNTFSVSTSGIYYLAVRATAVSGSAVYLSFDDIRVDLPCSLNGPSLLVSVASQTVCSDKPFTLNASGADTYTWSTNENTSAITVTPNIATTGYTVSGTKATTGCSSTLIQNITVFPSPIIFASSNSDIVCAGSPVVLTALGANITNYSWSNGVNLQTNVVNPTSNTTYSVLGSNGYGCSTIDTKLITVKPLPNITVTGPAQVCKGDNTTLTGNGGTVFNWLSNTAVVYLGNPVTLNPQASSIFTVTGTDANGCSNKAYYILSVEDCNGLNKYISSTTAIQVYPNPSNGLFTIDTDVEGEKTFELMSLTGQVIKGYKTSDVKTTLDVSKLPNGVYYLRIQMESRIETVKVILTQE